MSKEETKMYNVVINFENKSIGINNVPKKELDLIVKAFTEQNLKRSFAVSGDFLIDFSKVTYLEIKEMKD